MPLTVMSAVRSAHSSIVSDEDPGAALAARAIERLADPGGHAGRLERLADDEQRRDEERRSGRRSPPAPARGRARPSPTARAQTPIATTATGSRSQTKTTTTRGEDEGDVDWLSIAHGRGATPCVVTPERRDPSITNATARMPQSLCTGAPGPRGMPSRYQATKNSVQTIDSTRTYGSIIATTVPMPASRR